MKMNMIDYLPKPKKKKSVAELQSEILALENKKSQLYRDNHFASLPQMIPDYTLGAPVSPDVALPIPGIKELDSQKLALQQELIRAEADKRTSYYQGMAGNPDFAALSKPVEKPEDLRYQVINQMGSFSKKRPVIPSAFSQENMDITDGTKHEVYRAMNEQEKGIYNYLYSKQGKKEADKYLEHIYDSLSQRKGKEIAESTENYPAAKIAMSPIAGMDTFATGIRQNFFHNKAVSGSPLYYAGQNVRQGLDGAAGFLYDAGHMTGNMIPSIASNIAVPGSGLVAMGLSAKGNAQKEALEAGHDPMKAQAYGVAIGLLEALLEKALGGITKLSGGNILMNNLDGKVSAIKNGLVRGLSKYGLSAISEATEEGLQTALEPVIKTAILGDKFEPAKLEEIAYSAVLGAVGAGIFEGPTIAADEYQTKKLGKEVKRNNQAGDVLEQGLNADPETSAYAIAKKAQADLAKGKQPNDYQVGKILEQVAADYAAQAPTKEERIAGIGKALGREVTFYDGAEANGPAINGYFKDGKIFINRKSENPIAQIFGHELTHSVELSESYKELSALVLGRIRETSNIDKLMKEKRELYAKNNVVLSDFEVSTELVAEYAEKHLFTDEMAIRDLVKEKPTLGQKILNFIDRVLARFGNKNAQERVFLEKAREIYRRALDGAENTNGQEQYAIKDALYGEKYVEVDNNILGNAGQKKWRSIVMNHLKSNYPNGLNVDGRKVLVEKRTVDKSGYSKYINYLAATDKPAKKDRYKAYGNIDEIAEISKNYTNEGLYKKRADNIVSFDKADVLLSIDGNEYVAKIVIGNTKKGESLLYDIVDMARVSILKGGEKAQQKNPSATTLAGNGQLAFKSKVSNQNISQPVGNVKTRFSLSEKNQEDFTERNRDADLWEDNTWDLIRKQEKWQWQGKAASDLSPESMKVLAKREAELKRHIKKALGINKFIDSDAINKAIRSLTESYLRTGDVSDQLILNAFDVIRKQSIIKSKEFYEEYKHVKDGLRLTKITISQKDRADIPDFEKFRKKNFGLLTIVNQGGTPVDVLYHLLAEQYPDLFPDDIAHPADQLQHIADVASSIRISEQVLDDYYDPGGLFDFAKVDFSVAVKNMTAKLNIIERYEPDVSFNKERAKRLADPNQLDSNIEMLNEDKRKLIQSRDNIIKNHLLTSGDIEVAKLFSEGKLNRDQVMRQAVDGEAVIAVGIRDMKIGQIRKQLEELEAKRKARDNDQDKAARAERMELMEKGIKSHEDMEDFYKYRQQSKKQLDKLMNWKGFTEDDLQIIERWNLGEISDQYSGIDNSPQREQIVRAHELFNENQLWDRALKKYKQGLNEKRNKEADKYLKTVDKWKDKATGFQYSRDTVERNIYDVVPDRALAKSLIDRYITPIYKSEAEANKLKIALSSRVKELGISRKVETGNKVSESHAVQFLGEAYYHIKFLEKQRAEGMAKIDKVNYPAERRAEKVQELMDKTSGHGTLEHWKEAVARFKEENPNLNMPRVDNAIMEFQKIYDELFPMINEAYMRNGYDPMEYRRGYFPHYQESDGAYDFFAQYQKDLSTLFGWFGTGEDLSTELNGQTEYFKPGRRWFANALQRKGNNTVYDALEGFDRYLNVACDVIYHTDNIQSLRALARRVRLLGSDKSVREGMQAEIDRIMNDDSIPMDEKNESIEALFRDKRNRLSKFVVWLEDYTNILAGKKSYEDRWTERMFSRNIYIAANKFASRVSMNMVAGNISSALTNFVPLADLSAVVGTKGLMNAMWDTAKAKKRHDRLSDQSVFLINRRGYAPVSETQLEKAGRIASFLMEGIDQFSAEVVVRARYNQMIDRGLSHEAALDEADSFARSIMAGRSKGEMPTLFSAKTLKPFTMFQLEVNNHLSYLWKDMPRMYADRKKRELWAAFFKTFIAHWVINEMYEALYGRRVTLDPISILNDTIGDIWGHKMPNTINAASAILNGHKTVSETFETPSKKAPEVVKRFKNNILQEVPFVGGLYGGGRLPIDAAFWDGDNLNNAIFADWDAKKKLQVGAKELAKPLAYVGMPFGGGQIKKTIEGAIVAADGGRYKYDKEGNRQMDYPFYKDNPLEAAFGTFKALSFGRMASQEAVDWVDSSFKGLSVAKTAAMEQMIKGGMTRRAAFEIVSDMKGNKDIDNKKKLLNMDIPNRQKELAYKALFATEKEAKKIAEYKKAGLNINDYLSAATQKRYIDEKEIENKDKALELSRWINKQGYNDKQKAVVSEAFKFYQVIPVKANRYDKFVGAGMSEESSYKLANALSELKPEAGKAGVTRVQQMEAAIKAGLSEDDLEKAIRALAYEGDIKKMDAGKLYGLKAKDFVMYKKSLGLIGSGTSVSQAEAEKAIRKMPVPYKTKAILWQLQDARWKPENNPFDSVTGFRIQRRMNQKSKTHTKK